MGCYDTILFPCPDCGELYSVQSKADDGLRTFHMGNAPAYIVIDAAEQVPWVCKKCHKMFGVKIHLDIKTVPWKL